MDLGWDTRPVSLTRHARDWRSQTGSASSSTAPPSFTPVSSFSQRRRSSATQMPPAAPPPTQPIPRVPVVTSPSVSDTNTERFPQLNGHSSLSFPPQNLSTLPPSRNESFSTIYEASLSSSAPENLSDPPPPSILYTVSSFSHDPSQRQDHLSDRLLSPHDPHLHSGTRPSPRRALTKALELAREAVKLDSTNADPYGAVIAYGRSVALLSDVMERVRRGEDSTESSNRRRSGRRRSIVAQEEEVKRLKSIHDTYADRMNILSLIYSIPPMPHSPSSVYASTLSISSNSTRPPSPTTSLSPDSPERTAPAEPHFLPQGDRHHHRDSNGVEGRDAIDNVVSEPAARPWSSRSSADSDTINVVNHSAGATTARISLSYSSYHPYAAVEVGGQVTPTSMGHPMTRLPSSPPFRRPRASSNLPPPPPPPLTSPPPPPVQVAPEPAVEPSSSEMLQHPEGNRAREATLSGSRLAALEEESEKVEEPHIQDQQPYSSFETETATDSQNLVPDTPRVSRRDSPLPALPSPIPWASGPGAASDMASDRVPPSPGSSDFMAPRPRGTSTLSVRSDPSAQSQLINTSPAMGTISQRRSKASAPPGTGSPSPTEPSSASVQIGQKLTGASISSSTASSLGLGRARSSSQPGRRPSVVNGRISPHDQRPPLPLSIASSGVIAPRKASFPSKLNPNAQASDSLSTSSLATTAILLIPPPPAIQSKLPTTPTSPLPPAPPADALRKPYHLMNLLRLTMTSRTGGYITRRLHVPMEVWSQGGAKLNNTLEKVRVVDVLCAAFEELETCSVEYFGAGNVSSGLALGIGSIGRREGEMWVSKLEEFSLVCDGVVGNFGKKLSVGEGFVIKKNSGVTSWGGKLTRQLDKFTNGKNLDSPAEYVQGLAKLFAHAQLLDEHTKALSSQPMAPAYAAFPTDVRLSVEAKLKRISEFFATVVLTFVVRDLSQLLDKYVKKCEKWLAE